MGLLNYKNEGWRQSCCTTAGCKDAHTWTVSVWPLARSNELWWIILSHCRWSALLVCISSHPIHLCTPVSWPIDTHAHTPTHSSPLRHKVTPRFECGWWSIQTLRFYKSKEKWVYFLLKVFRFYWKADLGHQKHVLCIDEMLLSFFSPHFWICICMDSRGFVLNLSKKNIYIFLI